MENFNPLIFLWDFFNVLKDFANLLYNFLIAEHQIGPFKFIPVLVLGTGTIITIIVAKIIKEFI